ncbi:alpha-L-arabinofuranosidase [Aspergillus pseudoustus]|uniref:Alpha-L-arabinofuranosidase n=1 Tax=Aspergillus pseudoustus TaxID=1810923 RepID=A0ABR4INS4_9EURO
MATVAQSVNVISPLITSPRGLWKQTSYWPLLLFSRYMRGRTVATHVCCGVYSGETSPKWVQSTCKVPFLDVSASLDGEWMNLAVVNVDEARSYTTELRGIQTDEEMQVFVVGGDSNFLSDVNIEGKETVGIRESRWKAGANADFTFQKHSFTLLRWKVTP